MQHGRMALLALSFLSACAATTASGGSTPSAGGPQSEASLASGKDYSDYIVGRYAAARGDMGTASDRLRAAAVRDPADHALASQAFLTSLLAGQTELDGIARSVGDNPIAQLYVADEMARAGRWDAAGRRYAALPDHGLTGALRPLLVAWAEEGAGRTDAALDTLRPLAEARELRGIYALNMALIADQAGRAGDAAELYQAARRDYGTLNLRLGLILASAEARRGLLDRATQTVGSLVAANTDLAIAQPALDADVAQPAVPRPVDGIAEAYLAFGAALRENGAGELAEALLRLALLDRPDFTAARLLLSEIQDADKHPGDALATLRAVPATDPLHLVVELREAVLLDAMDDHAEAAALAGSLAHEDPTRPEPLAAAAEALRMEGRYADAASTYGQAIARAEALGAVPWTLYFERGICREEAGDWPGAQADLEHAVQLAPDQPVVLNYLAYSWAEHHEHLDRAREMLERAVAINPNDGSIVDSLGWVMLRQGDSSGAVKQLERAVELEPEDPVINGHLGDAYLAAGRKREAEFQWRRALTLKPKDADKARIEAKLNDLAPGALSAAPAGATRGQP
jgi:tetratricopeptide (TPR) repeat protein